MEEIKGSKVPKEIMDKHKRQDGKQILIAFGLEDKRKETFELPPPPKYTSFSGAGVSMGGGPAAQGGEVNVEASEGKPKVDANKPTTELRFRFHNG